MKTQISDLTRAYGLTGAYGHDWTGNTKRHMRWLENRGRMLRSFLMGKSVNYYSGFARKYRQGTVVSIQGVVSRSPREWTFYVMPHGEGQIQPVNDRNLNEIVGVSFTGCMATIPDEVKQRPHFSDTQVILCLPKSKKKKDKKKGKKKKSKKGKK